MSNLVLVVATSYVELIETTSYFSLYIQAIFKPFDEEPYAPNNPKGYVGKFGSKSMREGILSGEGAAREVAAFILDSRRVHGVPETFFAELYHPYFERQNSNTAASNEGAKEILPMSQSTKSGVKYGSLQFLKANDGESCDFSCRKFSVEQVQSIAILDMRILNCDRNEGNILVKQYGKDDFKLIPIDHALCLPDNFVICDYELCWSLWPQIEQPINEKLQDYLMQLDTKSNMLMLKKYLKLRPACLRNYRIAETTLVRAVQAGFNLFEISKIFYKLDPEGPYSVLEKIVKKAEEIYSVVKTNVCRNLYTELNCIHQKNNGRSHIHISHTLSQTAIDSKNRGESPKTDPSSDQQFQEEYMGELDSSPPKKREKTVFLPNSEINVKGIFDIKPREQSPEITSNATRKRAQSCMDSDIDMPVDSSGNIRLGPVGVDAGDRPVEIQSFSFKKTESETRAETPPKEIKESNPIKEMTSPKSLRRTISNPTLTKVKSDNRKTVEDSSSRGKPRRAEGSFLSDIRRR